MILRQVNFSDWLVLLRWRNDPLTRDNSFSSEEISETSHKEWLLRSLDNPDRKLYILEDKFPVATIRSDFIDNKYFLSWNVAPEHRGHGYGFKLLDLYLCTKSGEFIAEIKPTNIASIKMVEKNGFHLILEEPNKLTYGKNI